MPYLILAFDYEDQDHAREAVRALHRAHLGSVGSKLLGSGALLSDDGRTVIGGMSILDTDDYGEAKRFADDDPYTRAGIRKETRVIRWRNRWWEGQFREEV